MKTRNKNPQYNLRLPTELKEYLACKAVENNCSLNAEINSRLMNSVPENEIKLFNIKSLERTSPTVLLERVILLEKRIEAVESAAKK